MKETLTLIGFAVLAVAIAFVAFAGWHALSGQF